MSAEAIDKFITRYFSELSVLLAPMSRADQVDTLIAMSRALIAMADSSVRCVPTESAAAANEVKVAISTSHAINEPAYLAAECLAEIFGSSTGIYDAADNLLEMVESGQLLLDDACNSQLRGAQRLLRRLEGDVLVAINELHEEFDRRIAPTEEIPNARS